MPQEDIPTEVLDRLGSLSSDLNLDQALGENFTVIKSLNVHERSTADSRGKVVNKFIIDADERLGLTILATAIVGDFEELVLVGLINFGYKIRRLVRIRADDNVG